ncbi:MAG: tetraacyldisaccharide 4'-kinase [Pirellulaceae bacterium]|nr:tetraacyldisaccharide 4'-kinase [Pirellulaceae bacterium]
MMSARQWLVSKNPSLAARVLILPLRLLSLVYAAVMRLRNWGYDLGIFPVRSVDVPVICVGNLSVGGTGKTPMVAWICHHLRQQGVRVAIVSRGYGQLAHGTNDEALELELQLPDVPHLQNPDRYAAAQLAQDELDMQAIVLDDGFQHRRLGRSLDIVLVDACEPQMADWLLPAGLMRESWSGLRRAGVVVLTRSHLATAQRLAQLKQRVARYAPQAKCLTAAYQPDGLHGVGQNIPTLESLGGNRVLAFCGIGNPNSFFATLEQHSIELVDQRVYPDHHAYSAADVEQLQAWATSNAQCDYVLCTMKDWVKLQMPRLGRLPLLALRIGIIFEPHEQQSLENVLLLSSGLNAEPRG